MTVQEFYTLIESDNVDGEQLTIIQQIYWNAIVATETIYNINDSGYLESYHRKNKATGVRIRKTEEQLKVLRDNFKLFKKPNQQRLESIAQNAGLSVKVTKQWFINSESRQKTPLTTENVENIPSELHGGDSECYHIKYKATGVRTKFTKEQLKVLRESFKLNQYLNKHSLKYITQSTGLGEYVIQIWFQNTRKRQKEHLTTGNVKNTLSRLESNSRPKKKRKIDYKPLDKYNEFIDYFQTKFIDICPACFELTKNNIDSDGLNRKFNKKFGGVRKSDSYQFLKIRPGNSKKDTKMYVIPHTIMNYYTCFPLPKRKTYKTEKEHHKLTTVLELNVWLTILNKYANYMPTTSIDINLPPPIEESKI